jgi:hypothetical protein
MKKIIVLAGSVLFSTLVFANGTDKPSTSESSVAVLNSSGSNLFKVFYKAPHSNKVKVSILNEKNEVLFSETLRKMDGFVRPYNFDGLPEGDYVIQIEDEFGKQTEKVKYNAGKIEKIVNVTKSAEAGKYLLTGISKSKDTIHVLIYDSANQLLFEENLQVNGEFGQMYNLKYVAKPFTMIVSDSKGVLKSVQY